MAFLWRALQVNSLQDLVLDLNRQMKALESDLQPGKPSMMLNYPASVGIITDNTVETAPSDTAENTLKSTFIEAATIGAKGGFKLTAAGTASGAGGTKALRLYFGGEQVSGDIALATGVVDWVLEATFWNVDTTQEQVVLLRVVENLANDTMDVTSSYVDTT